MKAFDYFILTLLIWFWGTNLFTLVNLVSHPYYGVTDPITGRSVIKVNGTFKRDGLLGVACLGYLIWKHYS